MLAIGCWLIASSRSPNEQDRSLGKIKNLSRPKADEMSRFALDVSYRKSNLQIVCKCLLTQKTSFNNLPQSVVNWVKPITRFKQRELFCCGGIALGIWLFKSQFPANHVVECLAWTSRLKTRYCFRTECRSMHGCGDRFSSNRSRTNWGVLSPPGTQSCRGCFFMRRLING